MKRLFQLLLLVRRWCFLYSQTSRDRNYALSQYKWAFGAIMVPFYSIPIFAEAELGYKFGWRPLFTRGDSIHTLATAGFIFGPYIGLVWWFLNQAQQVEPVETLVSRANEKPGLSLLLMGGLGFSLMTLIPASLEKLIPLSR